MNKKQEELVLFDPLEVLNTEESNNNDIDSSQCAMAYIRIADKQSNVCDEDSDMYIPGIKPGDMYNSATKQIFKTLDVIPTRITEVYQAWTPEAKGLPVGNPYAPTDPHVTSATWVENDQGKTTLIDVNGNVLVHTFIYLVVCTDLEGKSSPAVLAMSKSRITAAKAWNTQIKTITCRNRDGVPVNPPKYIQQYTLKTVKKSFKANSWYVFTVEFKQLVNNQELFTAAKLLSTAEDVEIQPKEEDAEAPKDIC
jgi:hypothetical protein